MNKNFKPWTDEKIKHLFNYVEENKNRNICLVKIFKNYAAITNKKPNSIRNYYYNQIEHFCLNPNLAKKLNINLNLHKVKQISHFSKTDEETLKELNNLISNGYSVRKACLTLANGDINIMMRLQNKYRNMKQKSENKLNNSNILQFKPKNTGLTDNDINNLFLGLVKVIKKNAVEQLNKNLISECEWANNTLRKTLVSLNNKEKEIKSLSLKNTVLSKKLIDLTNEIARLKELSVQKN